MTSNCTVLVITSKNDMSRKVWEDNSFTLTFVVCLRCRGNVRKMSCYHDHRGDFTFTRFKTSHVFVNDKPKQRIRGRHFEKKFLGETLFQEKALRNCYIEAFRLRWLPIQRRGSG